MGVLRRQARGLPTLDGAAAGDATCGEPRDFGADAMERKVRGVGRLHPAPTTEPSSYFVLQSLGVPAFAVLEREAHGGKPIVQEVGVRVLTRSSGGSPLSSLILVIFLVISSLLLQVRFDCRMEAGSVGAGEKATPRAGAGVGGDPNRGCGRCGKWRAR